MKLVRTILVTLGREQCEVCGNMTIATGPADVREVYCFADSKGLKVLCCHECRGRCLAAESAEEFSEYRGTQ